MKRGRSRNDQRPVPRLWYWWLVVAVSGTIACSLLPLVAPEIARRLLSALVFGGAMQAYAFSATAMHYITFINGVVGAVMVGWSVALLLIIVGPFRRGERWAWRAVAVSLLAWFVPGTLFSVWSGVMRNVAANCLFIIAFAIPLVATYRRFHEAEV